MAISSSSLQRQQSKAEGRREEMAPPPLSLFLFLLLVHCLAMTSSAQFTCKATGAAATCRSLVGYRIFNATTYTAVASLFQVPPAALFGANGLPLSTPGHGAVAPGRTLRIPVPCRCENGTGWSDRTPVYTVREEDNGLYNITVTWFSWLTTFQEIGKANGLPDVNNITAGEKLWIPLPCSCDEVVGGEEVVHLAHMVEPGSSVAAIAEQFGTNESTLLRLNGMTDPKKLLAYQILDVPLHACSSSISNKSLDYGLRLAANSYTSTADGCITCTCSNKTYQLDCYQSTSSSKCPAMVTCQGTSLLIGNTSTTSGCEVQKCSYAGYTNTSTSVSISANITTDRTNCNSNNGGLRLKGLKWSTAILFFLHMIWLSFQ